MLMWFDGIVAKQNVLHELGSVTDHLRAAERRWRSNHPDEAIPRLGDAIVAHARWDQLIVFLS